jgi:hypothetical protein
MVFFVFRLIKNEDRRDLNPFHPLIFIVSIGLAFLFSPLRFLPL